MKELPKSNFAKATLDKAYEPQLYEDKIYERWEKSGFFNPDVCIDKKICEKDAEHFSIVLPPPNVTGTLHIGHAEVLSIQDLMVRYHRMKGDKTLWIPGTDHAAIATEAKVEKKLITGGMKSPKKELGKEKFLAEVRKFAQESHDIIINQTKKMGASLDWNREAFTLDEERNLAVKTVFKKMYDDGLIYRGFRVINWSVKGQSTCSDDELVHIERPGKIYTFKYAQDFPLEIATTRPETKFGDVAVAVNPKDKRYKKFVGQKYLVKNFANSGIDLNIQIIANESVDMEYGTGAVGVTPAHSAVDFDMYLTEKAKGNDLGIIEVIGKDGKMTNLAGSYIGIDATEAREQTVLSLKKLGLVSKEEETIQSVGTSDRFGDVVEALPMTQWFIDVNKKFTIGDSKLDNIKTGQKVSLKELMQTVVQSKQIEIIPERFDRIYFHWIDNLRDWCISRQIWYGHQIPVWYKGEEIYCDVNPPTEEGWVQDSDTLDTWFSSGLWTFSTLGYPDLNAEDLKNFHPTSVMETGYDILFFWVARMILMATYVLGDIPFEKVYLHGLVRDEQGRKMSKSLGNVIDPLDVCKKYGTDAVRLSLLLGNSPGNDSKLSEEKIAGFRNFSNKLWNMSRFMLMNIFEPKIDIEEPEAKTLADKWILGTLANIIKQVSDNIESFQFSQAGEQLREFTWDQLADWYLEIAKIEGHPSTGSGQDKSEILNYILNTILKLWHPFMPFVTEQIWSSYAKATEDKTEMLIIQKWPVCHSKRSEESLIQFNFIKNIIIGIRSLRAENKIEPAKKLNVSISAGDKVDLLKANAGVIKGLARLEELTIAEKVEKSDTAIGFVENGVEVFVDLAGAVDTEAEKERLEKEIASVEPYVIGLEKKLSNAEFVNNAPEKVVMIEKNKLTEAQEKLTKLKNQLNNLN